MFFYFSRRLDYKHFKKIAYKLKENIDLSKKVIFMFLVSFFYKELTIIKTFFVSKWITISFENSSLVTWTLFSIQDIE